MKKRIFPGLASKLPSLGLAFGLAFLPINASFAENGVTADKIVFGQSAALEGPAAALGNGMKLGILSAFKEANDKGGVHGRMLDLVTYDDGYEPDRSISNTKKLIDEDQVFQLIGAVGTPTSKVTQPIATEANVPFIAPFTGAGFLRDPSLKNVVNVRGTYDAETEQWIEYLTTEKGAKNIAILYQDDGFGRVGLAGVQKALEKRGMALVAEGTYKRNTTAVKSALLSIRKGKPDAIVMVGAYKPLAKFVQLAKKLKLDVPYVTISFVGSNAFSNELGDDGKGVIISQVVPFPWDTSIPVVAAYQDALKNYQADAKPGFVSLEGYVAGRLVVDALEKNGADLTRDSFLNTIYSTGTFDFGGITLTFGDGDNQGMDEIFMTVIEGPGQFSQIGG